MESESILSNIQSESILTNIESESILTNMKSESIPTESNIQKLIDELEIEQIGNGNQLGEHKRNSLNKPKAKQFNASINSQENESKTNYRRQNYIDVVSSRTNKSQILEAAPCTINPINQQINESKVEQIWNSPNSATIISVELKALETSLTQNQILEQNNSRQKYEDTDPHLSAGKVDQMKQRENEINDSQQSQFGIGFSDKSTQPDEENSHANDFTLSQKSSSLLKGECAILDSIQSSNQTQNHGLAENNNNNETIISKNIPVDSLREQNNKQEGNIDGKQVDEEGEDRSEDVLFGFDDAADDDDESPKSDSVNLQQSHQNQFQLNSYLGNPEFSDIRQIPQVKASLQNDISGRQVLDQIIKQVQHRTISSLIIIEKYNPKEQELPKQISGLQFYVEGLRYQTQENHLLFQLYRNELQKLFHLVEHLDENEQEQQKLKWNNQRMGQNDCRSSKYCCIYSFQNFEEFTRKLSNNSVKENGSSITSSKIESHKMSSLFSPSRSNYREGKQQFLGNQTKRNYASQQLPPLQESFQDQHQKIYPFSKQHKRNWNQEQMDMNQIKYPKPYKQSPFNNTKVQSEQKGQQFNQRQHEYSEDRSQQQSNPIQKESSLDRQFNSQIDFNSKFNHHHENVPQKNDFFQNHKILEPNHAQSKSNRLQMREKNFQHTQVHQKIEEHVGDNQNEIPNYRDQNDDQNNDQNDDQNNDQNDNDQNNHTVFQFSDFDMDYDDLSSMMKVKI